MDRPIKIEPGTELDWFILGPAVNTEPSLNVGHPINAAVKSEQNLEDSSDRKQIPVGHPLANFWYPREATKEEVGSMFNDFKAQGWKYEGVTAASTPGGQEILLQNAKKRELLWYPCKWAFTTEIAGAKAMNTRRINKGTRCNDLFEAREAEMAKIHK